jgi:pimeloyl-ACP methyl ester carboxylesterase
MARRRSWAVAALVVAVVVAVTACSGGDGGAPGGDGSAPTTGSSSDTASASREADTPDAVLTEQVCDEPGVPTTRVTCSVLVVPEDPTRPDERQVELAVMQVRPAADLAVPVAPGAPSLVHLHGGPGGEALRAWSLWTTVADALGREVVLYDQRGGGRSTPSLACPEHTEALLSALGAPGGPSGRDDVGAALRACHDRLRAEGIDLDQYDTGRSVDDLEALRTALGTERLTLLGTSYGTRLALEYTSRHPERVAALALDSVDVPGTSTAAHERAAPGAAVRRLLEACAQDPTCDRAHPSLGATLDAALRRADDAPPRLDVPATDTTPATSVLVTGDTLYAGLFVAMYDTLAIPTLPGLVEQLARGDDSILAAVGPQLAAGLVGTAVGATMSALCAEPADGPAPPATPGADPSRADTVVLASYATYCDDWPVERREDALTLDALASTEDPPPTLVVAGELDPVTPAATSSEVADLLDAELLVVPRAGHAPMLDQRCATDALAAFLEAPADPAVAPCAAPAPFL